MEEESDLALRSLEQQQTWHLQGPSLIHQRGFESHFSSLSSEQFTSAGRTFTSS